jgi:hypothetical protein
MPLLVMSYLFSARRRMLALETVLAITPTSHATAAHLAAVYRALTTFLGVSAVGAALSLRAGLTIPPFLATLLSVALLFNFLRRVPLTVGRSTALHAYCLAQGVVCAPLLRAASLLAHPMLPVVAFAATAIVFACFYMSVLLARRMHPNCDTLLAHVTYLPDGGSRQEVTRKKTTVKIKYADRKARQAAASTGCGATGSHFH